MFRSHRLSLEHLLYALALAAALALRLWGLGHAPLGESEARLALSALDVAARHPTSLGSAPLLTTLTGLAFALLGSTDAVARLVPALLGGLLPLLAWPLRPHLGRRAAIVLAFALAADPVLVALSRRADSPLLAVLFLAAAALAAAAARWEWALPLAVLGALSGQAFWLGLLALVLTAALWRLSGRPVHLALPPRRLRRGLALSAAVWVFGSTLFFWTPTGLGAALNSLSAFIYHLHMPPILPASRLLAALPAYTPLAVGAGLLGAWLVYRRRAVLPLAGFFLALGMGILTVLLPAGRLGATAWLTIALWLPASWALSHLTRPDRGTLWQGTLTLILLSFAWFNLLAWSHTAPGSRLSLLSISLAGLSVATVPLLSALLTLSTPQSRTWQNTAWGVVLGSAVFTLAALAHAAYGPRPAEVWYPDAVAPQTRLLQHTVADFGQWQHGRADTLEVALIAPQDGLVSLRWLLHVNPNAYTVPALPPDALPEAILAPTNWRPAQTNAYRGQDFPLIFVPPYRGGNFPSLRTWIQWLAFRQPLTTKDKVILWVRADLFPAAQSPSPEAP